MTIRHNPIAHSAMRSDAVDRIVGRRASMLGYLVGRGVEEAGSVLAALRAEGVQMIRCSDIDHVIADSAEGAGFAILDYQSNASFEQAAKRMAEERGDLRIIAFLPSRDFKASCAAFRSGAFDVIAAPVDQVDISTTLRRVRGFHQAQTNDLPPIRSLEDMEKEAISEALTRCSGQVSLTARQLGIGRSTLYRKLEQYGIDNPRH